MRARVGRHFAYMDCMFSMDTSFQKSISFLIEAIVPNGLLITVKTAISSTVLGYGKVIFTIS